MKATEKAEAADEDVTASAATPTDREPAEAKADPKKRTATTTGGQTTR